MLQCLQPPRASRTSNVGAKAIEKGIQGGGGIGFSGLEEGSNAGSRTDIWAYPVLSLLFLLCLVRAHAGRRGCGDVELQSPEDIGLRRAPCPSSSCAQAILILVNVRLKNFFKPEFLNRLDEDSIKEHMMIHLRTSPLLT